jgi:hypothetical protein
MFCCLVVLLSCCPHAPLPCLHPRLAVVVPAATHPFPPQSVPHKFGFESRNFSLAKIPPHPVDSVLQTTIRKSATRKLPTTTAYPQSATSLSWVQCRRTAGSFVVSNCTMSGVRREVFAAVLLCCHLQTGLGRCHVGLVRIHGPY